MKVGIGLPGAIPGASGTGVVEWARRAEAGPFSTLGLIDRLVYPNHEPMVSLAAAAGATTRVRLMTTVLLGVLRPPALLAKQAATLDSVSGGRLTLGLGIGSREGDFRAVGQDFRGRGRRLAQEIRLMRRAWAGEELGDGLGPVGPPPVQRGGPEILIGGTAAPAMRRAGRVADGYLASAGTPDALKGNYEQVQEAWSGAGRQGRPRFLASGYFALGPGVVERGAETIRNYYGPAAERVLGFMATTPDRVRERVRALEDIGVEELILWPTVTDLDEVERLAQVVG